MGWWKNLQDTLHPPPPRRAPPPDFVPLLADTSSSTSPSIHTSDLESSRKKTWNEKIASAPRRSSFILRRTFGRILVSMIMITLFMAILSISGLSVTRLSGSERPSPSPPIPWEKFPFLKKYYKGMFNLIDSSINVPEYPPALAHEREAVQTSARPDAVKGIGKNSRSRVFNPYPKYGNDKYKQIWEGEYKECSFDEEEDSVYGNRTRERPEIRVFDGTPEGMPAPVFGSHGLLGIDDDVCFDRYGRYGTYGYGYNASEGGLGEAVNDGGEEEMDLETGWGPGNMPFKRVDWRGIDWGTLQRNCFEKNKDRFGFVGTKDTLYPDEELLYIKEQKDSMQEEDDNEETPTPSRQHGGMPGGTLHKQKKHHPRTAVLVRAWSGYKFSPGDIAFLRSLISELSINSGGEYTIYLLVHCKDNKVPIWSDHGIYRKVLQENVPEEFWGITELWNEAMMGAVYTRMNEWKFRDLPLHGVYRSTFMPVQWFAHRHQEYDFFWNLEIDARYLGHWYQLFDKMGSWAKQQPRKHLWERNGRFYIPEVHGSYSAYSETISKSIPANSTVWGPPKVHTVTIHPDDPIPPFSSPEEDMNSTWGVDEDADLLTMNPIFDPEGTDWGLGSDVTGYGTYTEEISRYTQDPYRNRHKGPPPPHLGTHTDPPRRASIVAISRLSRRLLDRMHWENAVEGHTMFSEMWPASCALHHGLKAVFVPHPTYIDRKWPTDYLERTFNMGIYGKRTVFGESNQHNFLGSSWFYVSGFPAALWTRWLGGVVNNDGGETWDRRDGRMCLKGVLMHPIKGL